MYARANLEVRLAEQDKLSFASNQTTWRQSMLAGSAGFLLLVQPLREGCQPVQCRQVRIHSFAAMLSRRNGSHLAAE